MSGPERLALPWLFFALGGFSLVVQSALVRELLVVVHGTELVLGLLLASWLLWIGLAALIGIRLAARARRPALQLRIWIAIGALAPLAQIEFLRRGHALLGISPGLVISWQQALLLALIAMAPLCFVVGVTFPLGCKMMDREGAEARSVGRLYMFESAGALAGGLLYSLVLVGRVGPMTAVAAGAAILIGISGLLHRGASRVAGLVIAGLIAAASPFVASADAYSRHHQLARAMPGQELVAIFDTPYEQIAVGRLDNQLTVYGNGLPLATIPEPYEIPARVYRMMAQAPAPRRVLVLGSPVTGWAGGILRAARDRAQVAEPDVTFVFADARLVDALMPLLPQEEVRAIGNVRLVHRDPRAFLRSTAERFDWVVVDEPEPVAVYINRFYTADFYRAVRNVLTPAGVLGFRLPSSSEYVGQELSELAVSVHKAVASVFPQVVVTAGEQSWFFASLGQNVLTAEPATVAARLDLYPGARPYRDTIALEYDPDQLLRHAELLTSGEGALTNTDEHPSSYYYGAALWERFSEEEPSSRSVLARAHAFLRGVSSLQLAAALGVLLGIWLIARLVRRRAALSVDSAMTSAVAGFSSMTINIVLLIAYQSACGALYERIAVMTAMMMAGIALGSGTAAQWQFRRPPWTVAAVLAATALFAAGLPAGLRWLGDTSGWSQQCGFAASFAAAGALLGAMYPSLARVLTTHGARADAAQAGGLIDGFDHGGAALGALVAGTLVLPCWGATRTLRQVAILMAAVCGVWVLQGLRARDAR